MPLYECSKCGVVDNTALANFWEAYAHGGPLLCSACDPQIGQWHGKFARETVAEHMARFPESRIEYRQENPQQKTNNG